VNKCEELIELISAFADDELSGSDKELVENHLAECKNCSTILEVYREISISADESSLPAPEALRIGVMNVVYSEKIHDKPDKAKQRSRFQFALTRFAPIAACLVVGLLMWQFWGDLFGARDSTQMPVAAPEAAMPAPAAAPAAPAPQADMNMMDTWDDVSEEGDMYIAPEVDAAGRMDPAAPAALAEPEESIIIDQERTQEETQQIMDFIGGAYAEITITGELPALLKNYDPLPFGSWFGWERVYEIPTAEAQKLIAEIGNREDVVVARFDENANSLYAVVMYSP